MQAARYFSSLKIYFNQNHIVKVRNFSSSTTRCKELKPRPYSEIPGPKPIPLLGNGWRFLPGVGTFDLSDILAWSNGLHDQYGDIVKVSNLTGRNDMILIFDPISIEKVYRNEGAWPTRFLLQSVKYFRDNVRGDFFEGNQGIVNENGENWHKARTVVNPPMMQPKVAKQYAGRIDQVSQDFVKRVASLRDSKSEMPDNFLNELRKWVLESISLIALDTRLGCLESNISENSDPQQMIRSVDRIFELSFEMDLKFPFWKFFNTPVLKEFVKESEIFLSIANKYVELAREKMSESTPEDDQSVLQRILQRDPSTKRAVIMAMDMISGGIDSTSNTVATVLYYLSRHPECQDRLYSEVSKIIPAGSGTHLTAEQVDSMKYLRACIKEAMRLTPTLPLNVRCLTKEVELNNYLIPANTDIMMMHCAICNMDKYFPEAKRYMPERWLREEQDNQHKGVHPFAFLPFGYGPRKCVGLRFANLEMETLIARMIRNFQIEWHHPALTFINKLVQMPNDPLKFKMINRPN